MRTILSNLDIVYLKCKKGLGRWTKFYRHNPHRLALEYFGMKWLTPMQCILIDTVLKFPYLIMIASRGMGKTILLAVCICIKAVLYPGIKIVISAGKRRQSLEIILKIQSFCMDSENLRREIEDIKVGLADGGIVFKNGSSVTIATASENARAIRANWIIYDEFVKIPKIIIDTVIRKFKAGVRVPAFKTKPKYKNYPDEENCETYISSATYKHHWAWLKFKDFFNLMVQGKDYAVLGFPWQFAVAQGYYPLKQVIDEMNEASFNSVSWSMEMDSLFYGESENAFFSFNEFSKNREIVLPVYPKEYYKDLRDGKFRYTEKQEGEIRLLVMDVATQGGDKNDNSAYVLYRLIPDENNQYTRYISYIEAVNGGHSLDQALRFKYLYYNLDVDYVGIDALGVGTGVFDNLVIEIRDEERDIVYPAWNTVDDDKMSGRCKINDAPKIIYSIKASQIFNSECAVRLKDDLRRGKVKLLVGEELGSEELEKIKGFEELSIETQTLFRLPYIQTTALVNEAVNLSYEIQNNNIKVKEASGMRKDRYSACSYGNQLASEIEKDLYLPNEATSLSSLIRMKTPVYERR